jgi:NhaP-type Na+/H+ or K+/H+ antiporter
MIEPADLLAILLAVAVLLGCINHLWIRLPPAIGMLLGSMVVSLLIACSDRLFHLHVMGWFRGTLDADAAPLALTRARLRDKMRDTAVLTWAGLRGGISIALALTLSEGAWRTELLVAVYAVVVFTIVVQGLTISRFLKWVYAADKPA